MVRHILEGLLGDIPVPKATAETFGGLFDRHRQELERLANTHQGLVGEALEVAFEVLPSVKTMASNGGQLRLNRTTYAKVSNLMARCESLASPELARDLREAKTLVERRMTEADPESLIIDFRE